MENVKRVAPPRAARPSSLRALVLIPLLVVGAHALPVAAVELPKQRVAGGGGGYVTINGWSLAGTIGQHEAGVVTNGAWTLSGGFWTGGGIVTGVEDPPPAEAPPLSFRLYPVVPQPLRASGMLRFDLPEDAHVRADLFDVAGRQVRLLWDADLPRGRHALPLDVRAPGEPLPAGIYLLRLATGGRSARQRVVILH